MATLDDILTTQKNGVIAINNLSQTTSTGLINPTTSVAYLSTVATNLATIASNITSASSAVVTKIAYLAGTTTSATVTAQTLIIAGAGRLVSFSVIIAGTAAGTINNSATTGAVAAGNALVAVPTTIGSYQVGQHFSAGLVITPGAGQSINLTYSLD